MLSGARRLTAKPLEKMVILGGQNARLGQVKKRAVTQLRGAGGVSRWPQLAYVMVWQQQ